MFQTGGTKTNQLSICRYWNTTPNIGSGWVDQKVSGQGTVQASKKSRSQKHTESNMLNGSDYIDYIDYMQIMRFSYML